MKRVLFKVALMMLAIIMLAGTAAVPRAAAADGYTVTLSDGTAGTATVSVGDRVTIHVTVTGDSFNGLQGALLYDSTLFELKSLTGPAAADDTKTVKVELYTLSDTAYADGTEIATAVFTAKAAGTGTFSMDSITVGDYEDFRWGDAVPATVVNDKVTVKGGGGNTGGGGVQPDGNEGPVAEITVTPRYSGFEGSTQGKRLSDGSIEITVKDKNGNPVAEVPGGVYVTIPNVQDGQAVVIIGENGEIIDLVEKSLVENHVAYVLLPGTARIRIIDNSKYFRDVRAADWYSSYADFASSHELFVGVEDEVFAPDDEMSRAMMVTVLWRLENRPAAETVSSFTDVQRESWYDLAVDWAAENGITQGYDDATFGPNDSVTREQMATLFYRYMKDQSFDVSASGDFSVYADGNEVSDWAVEAMRWAVGSGLFIGRSDIFLAPKATATRAEVATMLMRLVAMMVKPIQ